MKLVINGTMVTASLYERAGANVEIRFRLGKDRTQYTTSSGARRKRQVTVSVIEAAITKWLEKRPQKPPEPPTEAGDLLDEIRTFLEEEYQYASPDHRAQVESILLHMASMVPTKRLGDITKDYWKVNIRPTLETQVGPKTWANKLSYIRKFFRWEVERENLLRDPTLGTKSPPKELFGTHEEIWEEEWYIAVRNWLLRSEIRTVKATADILEDLWLTGMDVKDLWELEPAKHLIQVTFQNQDGSKGSFWKVYKKRAKETEIIDLPLHEALVSRWTARMEAGIRLHPTKARTAKAWGNIVRKWVHRGQIACSIPTLDLKSIRHTFATRLAKTWIESGGRAGPSPDELRRWLGHAPGSRVLEKIYVKWGAWTRPAGHALPAGLSENSHQADAAQIHSRAIGHRTQGVAPHQIDEIEMLGAPDTRRQAAFPSESAEAAPPQPR